MTVESDLNGEIVAINPLFFLTYSEYLCLQVELLASGRSMFVRFCPVSANISARIPLSNWQILESFNSYLHIYKEVQLVVFRNHNVKDKFSTNCKNMLFFSRYISLQLFAVIAKEWISSLMNKLRMQLFRFYCRICAYMFDFVTVNILWS